MNLDEAEVLVTLIFEYFGEQSNLVLLLDICLHAINDCGCPLDDEWLETVLLIQICVHILLQRLLANLVLHALFIEFDFLGVHILYGVLKLLQCENAVLSPADRGIVSSVLARWARGCLGSSPLG
jgi:hypothetical protein